ncbi:hypothetical protein HBB16_02325, partial [Pseudonocardia sp. MCCB 268]|nr:hypothetical protein [Pseudonocardia cytotoxica]
MTCDDEAPSAGLTLTRSSREPRRAGSAPVAMDHRLVVLSLVATVLSSRRPRVPNPRGSAPCTLIPPDKVLSIPFVVVCLTLAIRNRTKQY